MDQQKIIDLQLGEVRVIRDITLKLFDLEKSSLDIDPEEWEYQINGYQPLVKLLEDKHAAPVIITNGAIQSLHAVMHVLKHKKYNNLGFRIPYWSRIPEIAKRANLNYTAFEGTLLAEKSLNIDSYLFTIPNNPDGYLPTMDLIRMTNTILKEQEIPFIHDAVYYTRSYLPIDHPIEPIGDIQIFSASKSYGLSSLRIGYLVVYNASFYRELLDFMEFSTVGASIAAQKLFLRLLKREEQLPLIKQQFDKLTREEIKKAKSILQKVNPNYIELSPTFEKDCGMFAWVKPKVENLFEKINVAVSDGAMFGRQGYVRMNLLAGNDIAAEIVNRINYHV